MNRSCGVLMHITSLPSPYGIGTFGSEAEKFADYIEIKALCYVRAFDNTAVFNLFGDVFYFNLVLLVYSVVIRFILKCQRNYTGINQICHMNTCKALNKHSLNAEEEGSQSGVFTR